MTTIDTNASLTLLSDDEIAAVGGGVGPLFGLYVFLGILLVGSCGNACN